MQNGKKEFKVNQLWKLRNGNIVQIESVNSTEVSALYPIKSADGRHWTEKGYYYFDDGDYDYDLAELIQCAAPEDKQSTNKYSVEEVIAALCILVGDSYYMYISEIEDHLSKTKDPEYQKYLELKAKFE